MASKSTKTSVESNAKPARTTQAAPVRATQAGGEPESIGKAHAKSPDVATEGTATGKAGSERALDEEREGGPRFAGAAWEVADERGDARYGHSRNDDSLTAQATALDADGEPGERVDGPNLQLDDSDRDIEGSGQRAGMGRGEKPRKTKSEER